MFYRELLGVGEARRGWRFRAQASSTCSQAARSPTAFATRTMCSACCRSSSKLLPSSPCSSTSSLSPPRTTPQAEDRELSNYSLKLPNRRPEVKEVLERRSLFKYFLLIITMIGTDMVNGDGTLTPCISDGLHWPMFVVATLSAIIASQAMISGTFSIIQQSLALGCFPGVKIIHTLSKYEVQVYIREVNYALTLACVAVTFAFRDIVKIGNPYCLAVVFVMISYFIPFIACHDHHLEDTCNPRTSLCCSNCTN